MTGRSKTLIQYTFDVTIDDSGCWNWNGGVNGKGYGPHRKVWEKAHGHPIPEGFYVDHICRNHRCIFPEHLRLLTPRENIRAGISAEVNKARFDSRTHCRSGHLLAGNFRWVKIPSPPFKKRVCKTCADKWRKQWVAKNPEYHRDWQRKRKAQTYAPA